MLAIQRRSLRRFLSILGVVALTASALAAAGAIGAAAVDDTITVIPDSGEPIGALEGQHTSPQIGAPAVIGPKAPGLTSLVGKFTDTGNPGGEGTDCSSDRYLVTINWGDGTSSDGSFFCDTSNGITNSAFNATGDHIYADSGNYTISVTVADQSDDQTSGDAVNTDTATISDATISYDDYDNSPSSETFQAVEGASVTVGAAFLDSNQAFPTEGPRFDPGISGTIDWGDGSALQTVKAANPPSACECANDAWITGSHVYDANMGDAVYTIKVTAKDDGGSSATHNMTAKISDAKLTAGDAKSFVAPGAQASTPVVASFTDAAGSQAKVGDFTATINWGDGSSSAGTLTQTAAGAFDVTGTHTYATAGTKSLTIKVDDEEGQTVSMTATATVPALPATGQPQTPVQPSTPLVPLLGLVFGLAIAVGGSGLIVARRIRS